MRAAIAVALVASVSFAEEPKPVVVSGVAEVTQPWCGGATPPPGQSRRVLPHANVRFVVKPGTQNTVVTSAPTTTTDHQGHFTISLTPGSWCFVPAERVDVPPSEAAKRPLPAGELKAAPQFAPDFACLDKEWARCTAVIEVADQPLSDLKLMTFRACSFSKPCPPAGAPPPTAPPSSRR